MSRFFFFVSLVLLLGNFACQVPSLPNNLRPCQSDEECDGKACIQGLCSSATRSTTNKETLPAEQKTELVSDIRETSSPESSPETESLHDSGEHAAEPSQDKQEATPDVSELTPETAEPKPEQEPAPEPSSMEKEPMPEQQPEPACQEGDKRDCYTGGAGTLGIGECKAGGQTCQNGQWTACTGQVLPTTETCNTKDDDCNGKIDEGWSDKLGTACSAGMGLCQNKGTVICNTAGNDTTCSVQPLPSQAEVCNGKDDDCDGKTDEQLNCQCNNGATRPCGSNIGECKQGQQTCQNGSWGPCGGEVTPTTETCNGRDDNCDGSIDNVTGLGAACITSHPGICNAGIFACDNNNQTIVCNPSIAPGTRSESCNGKDDDCDGKTDENNPGGGGACNYPSGQSVTCPGIKVCSSGTIVCNAAPTTEKCNGIDDDCDGSIDETFASMACGYGILFISGSNLCVRVYSRCVGGQVTCVAAGQGTYVPVTCSPDTQCTPCPNGPTGLKATCQIKNQQQVCAY